MKKITVSFRLRSEQIAWLDDQAAKADLSRTDILTLLIDHFRSNTEMDGSIMPRLRARSHGEDHG